MESTVEEHTHKKITLRGAIFLGIGSMVGAGIFALFGQAGAIAGSAVWLSFLIGGTIAMLQGYSFAKLGEAYPSSGGIVDWIIRGYGRGLFTGGIVMLGYFSFIIVASMVAVSFGSYATELFLGEGASAVWNKIFAVGILILLTFVNSIGADKVTRAQTAIVTVVLIVLTAFAIAMLVNLDRTLLAPANYPPFSQIFASVALTFFSYLGFGVIAFTGGDLVDAKKNLPRAMYISLGFTILLYVSLALGVFGTLTVEEVIANAETALAVAALPIFGAIGYTMISIAALFATTGSINSQLYATMGAASTMARDGILPPVFGEKRPSRPAGTKGLVYSAIFSLIMVLLFDMSAIASIGSAVALVIYVLITVAHLRMAKETGASRLVLIVALIATSLAVLLFATYIARTEPQTFVTLIIIIVLAWVVEAIWRNIARRRAGVTAS